MRRKEAIAALWLSRRSKKGSAIHKGSAQSEGKQRQDGTPL